MNSKIRNFDDSNKPEAINIPAIENRLLIPLSVVEGVKNPAVQRLITIADFKQKVTSDEQLKKRTEAARKLKNTDPSKYKSTKENSLGVIPGEWKKRSDKACQKYWPLLFSDLDGCKDFQEVKRLMDIYREIPEVFMVFPSFSGLGLRIAMLAESTLATHKEVYQAGAAFLNSILQASGNTTAKIDTSCSNPSRMFFENYVEEADFYINPESKVFSSANVSKTISKTTKKNTPSVLSEQEKIGLCTLITECKNGIPEGQNNYVFTLACVMCEHGISENAALTECLKYELPNRPGDPFTAAEIKKTVHSAYKKAQFRKFSDNRLIAWKAKFDNDNSGGKQRPKDEVLSDTTESEDDLTETKAERDNLNKFQKIKKIVMEKHEFRLNIVSLEIECRRKTKSQTNTPYKVLNENNLIVELYEFGFTKFESMLMALLRSDFVPRYDPFVEYFETLPKWTPDNPDNITILANYVTAKNQEWFNIQFKKMLVRAVACALTEIPFNKQCGTFVGKQNDGKTTFIRFLCPHWLKPYIKENVDLSNKDGRIALCQNLIINLDELSCLNKNDINKVKQAFTTDWVKERLPYDKKLTSFPRRATFFASTNSDDFLTDETGNVRWLVFEIDGIKHDNGGPNGYNRNIDIDLVWAQAYYLFKNGFKFQMTREELQMSEKNNRNYQVVSVEEELIKEYFTPASSDEKDAIDVFFLTSTKIKEEIEKERGMRINLRRLGKALKLLGFTKGSKYDAETKYTQKGYFCKKINS